MDVWAFGEGELRVIYLETGRLVLRNLRAEDVDVMFDYRNNEVCARYQRGQTKERAEIAALVERRSKDVIGVDAPFMLAVALKESNEMVGEIVVMPKDGTISMGYTFSYHHHRRGYASRKESEVFGKWLKAETEEEILRAVAVPPERSCE